MGKFKIIVLSALLLVFIGNMSAVPTAPDYFGKIVIPWAKKHPADSRAPEALHLTVKATRFGRTDSESGKLSREAFQLLHSKYANTEWAKKTPYWYRD
jgi:hypothetical protein